MVDSSPHSYLHAAEQVEDHEINDSQKCTVRLLGLSCSTCGYCSGERASLVDRHPHESSKSYGMLISSKLSAENYYKLIQRGWRRSGQHLYKPENFDSCCPALTIRLPVADFNPTRSQRRVINKMQRALSGGDKVVKASSSTKKARRSGRHDDDVSMPILGQLAVWTRDALLSIVKDSEIPQSIRYKISANNDETVSAVSTVCAAMSGLSKGNCDRGILSTQVVQQLKHNHPALDLSIEAHEASGQIRCTLSKQNLQMPPACKSNGSITMDSENSSEDLLCEWFRNHVPQAPVAEQYKLSITTHSALASSLIPEVHQLYFAYQQIVHNDPSPVGGQEEADWGDATTEFIKHAQCMLRTTYPNLTPNEWLNMTASFASFYRFLVESPLSTGAKTGTFHQHYRINGTLIAVGVVDILPECLSSVYAFYNASFAHTLCPLGKFTILKEIDFCQEQGLPHYYLGYYIHSCDKMRYKVDYHPSQLLCPATSRWVGAHEGQATLDKESPERHCCRLYLGRVASEYDEDNMDSLDASIQSILLYVGLPNLFTLTMLPPNGQQIVRPIVQEFVKRVGAEVSRDCILRLS